MSKLKTLSPNAPCPCGAGNKYKRCCYEKGFHYLVRDDGTIVKSVLMSAMPERERQELGKFLANAPPGEPLFKPELWDRLIENFREVGAPEAWIYAVNKTGFVLSPENRHLMPKTDIKAFEDAMAEYERTQGNDPDLH